MPRRSAMDGTHDTEASTTIGGSRLSQVWLFGQLQPAGLGGAACEPGPRQRPRGLAARALGRSGGVRALGRAGADLGRAEDLFLGLAGEQRLELLAFDRLALEQQLGDRLEVLAVLGEDVLGRLMRALDDAADLVVDLARDLVRVVGL